MLMCKHGEELVIMDTKSTLGTFTSMCWCNFTICSKNAVMSCVIAVKCSLNRLVLF